MSNARPSTNAAVVGSGLLDTVQETLCPVGQAVLSVSSPVLQGGVR